MVIIGFLYLTTQTYLALSKPKLFVLSYLLYLTSFFGFIPNSIRIGGDEIGLFYQSVLMMFSYLIFYKNSLEYPKCIRFLLFSILALYICGLLYPFVAGYTSFFHAVIASKDFSTVFFMHYLFVHKRSLSVSWIRKCIYILGGGFMIVFLLLIFTGFIPPEYVKKAGVIQYDYPTLFSLAIFVYLGSVKRIESRVLGSLFVIVWLLGMQYEDHLAIMVTTALGALFIIFRLPILYFITKFQRLLFVSILLVGSMFLSPLSKYLEILYSTPSFVSRSIYNADRIRMISEKPFLGYGFLHKSALNVEDSHVYNESLSFIDSGYLDLLGKFGILGTIFFLIVLTIPFFQANDDILLLSLKVYFLQFFLLNITWSVFSFTMGLIPLGLALYLFHLHSKEI